MRRLDTLDYYRALGAILVIFIHITATPIVSLTEGPALPFLVLLNRFSLPAVPMFIFASGMALSYSYREKPFHYGQFLLRRFTKILVPYLAWCAVYYRYYIYRGWDTLEGWNASWPNFFERVWDGDVMYHLYFVVLIVKFYLLFFLFLWIVKKVPGKIVLPAAALINLAAIQLVPAGQTDRSIFIYLFYFVLGCYFGKEPDKALSLLRSRWKWLILPCFLGAGLLYSWKFYAGQVLGQTVLAGWDLYIYLIFCSLGMMVYYLAADGLARAGLIPRLWTMLSAASYYIYLAHPFCILIADQHAPDYGIVGIIKLMAVEMAVIYLTAVPLSILYTSVKGALKTRLSFHGRSE